MTDDIDTLARTIYGEARSGGRTLMSAVASTILNRVAKQTWYGLTISEVCKKNNGKGIYQFSCWNAADPNCEVINDVDDTDMIFCVAQVVAEMAVNGKLADNTNGATHYYSSYIPEPHWAAGHTPCAAIGNMLFFNDIE